MIASHAIRRPAPPQGTSPYTGEIGMKDYQFTLLAGIPQTINTVGNYVCFVKATDEVQIRFDDNRQITRRAGAGVPVPQYAKAEIRSAVDQVVTLSFGYVENTPYDSSAATFTGTVNVSAPTGANMPTTPDVTVANAAQAQLLPANANRISALITNPATSAGAIRIGDSSTGAARGLLLQPGSTATLDTSAALFAHNSTGAAVAVSIAEITQ